MIIVTGANGLVGQYLKEYNEDFIFLDGKKHFDLTSESEVKKLFYSYENNIDAVIHLAATVGGIIDNIAFPVKYIQDNLLMNTLLLKYTHKYNIDRFIGIASTCIYPDKLPNNYYPLSEKHLFNGKPQDTNFAYAMSKRAMVAHICAYKQQYKKQYQYLIPCNLYGKYDKINSQNSHYVTSLIQKIINAKKNNKKQILLYGTGKPLRQFMYAKDLTNVIIYCLKHNIIENMNVASPEVYSIKEIAEIALSACDAKDIKLIFNSEYPDGQYRKDVSIKMLKQVYPEFNPTTLYNGIKTTYESYLKVNEDKYEL